MRPSSSLAVTVACVLAALLAFPGCGSDRATGAGDVNDSASQTVNLNDPYGGFLPVSEEPAFDDAEVSSLAGREAPQEDGYAGLSEGQRERARAQERDPARLVYSLSVLWGDLQLPDWDATGDPPPERDPLTWDGSMTLSNGTIKVVSLIDFERDEDFLLPRETRESVSWVSVTSGGFDGLRVLILLPSDSTGGRAVETLTFVAGDFVKTFTTDALEELDELFELGDGSEVSFRAFRVNPLSTVAHGFCSGRWGWAEGDSVGTFRGHWIGGQDGALFGYMRGHYGVDAQGRQVFFGKLIHLDGGFGGFLRGHWEAAGTGQDDSRRAHGNFQGEWANARGSAVGRVRGHWSEAGRAPGVFSGAWSGRRITVGS
ncbi:MAG: hypothetical protein FJY75_10285 [Candidatus Eisenbacteria bacterium]|uniref:Transferrin-binding protein-like solute binding protein n=1 Tax=Eiseniibacteriota bacterium TaxID=2212470 RepID=A0A937XE23_UNCEI|nr:hypothetical protein [Candidatus Eisenbacteria bacterium]